MTDDQTTTGTSMNPPLEPLSDLGPLMTPSTPKTPTTPMSLNLTPMTLPLLPISPYLMVEPLKPKEVTAGGLELPQQARVQPNRGVVLAMSAEATRLLETVAVGDTVMYQAAAGMQIDEGEGEAARRFLFVTPEDLIAYVVGDLPGVSDDVSNTERDTADPCGPKPENRRHPDQPIGKRPVQLAFPGDGG